MSCECKLISKSTSFETSEGEGREKRILEGTDLDCYYSVSLFNTDPASYSSA